MNKSISATFLNIALKRYETIRDFSTTDFADIITWKKIQRLRIKRESYTYVCVNVLQSTSLVNIKEN